MNILSNLQSNLQRSHDNMLLPEDEINDAILFEFKGVHGNVISIIENKITRLSDELSARAKLELMDKFGNICFDIDSATEGFLLAIKNIIAKAATNNPKEPTDCEDED